MCTGHSATTDNDHHTANNQLSRCCKLHADWSVRNVTEYDSLLMITPMRARYNRDRGFSAIASSIIDAIQQARWT